MTRFACLCCGFLTLDEAPPGSFAICAVCGWEDDYSQGVDVELAGGANRPSLTEARHNFATIGVSDHRLRPIVRPPQASERPAGNSAGDDEHRDDGYV
jgi:hypothetical protein